MRGAGTQENPYIIQTPQDLQAIQNNLSAYYELANDIDMTGVNWTPIAPNSTSRFTGVIDGKGYKILNFSINTTKDQQAFMVWTGAGATFRNISFENAYIRTQSYSAVWVVRAEYCIFENCYVRGRVEGTSHNAVFSYATINASFRNCFVDATVTGSYAGAFTQTDSLKSAFYRCYSNANVPFIYKPNTNAGYQTTFQYCYFNKTKYNGTNTNGLTGLTDTQMKQQSSFAGWDFTNVWYMPQNDYPKLRVGAKTQKITVSSNINSIFSSISSKKKSIKCLQSYTNTIQTQIQRHTRTKRENETYIQPIQTDVKMTHRSVRSENRNIFSYIKPLSSDDVRKVKTKRYISSYIEKITSDVYVLVPKKPIFATVSIYENQSFALVKENTLNIDIIENRSTIDIIENRSYTQSIENSSFAEVI